MENVLCIDVSDERLWQAFKSGKENAFANIYRKNVRSLTSYGYKLTSDSTLIEDCIHDLFIELWRRRNYLSDITSIKLYLFRALDRKLKRKMVQQRKKSCNLSNLNGTCEMPLECNWISQQIEEENAKKLRKAIDTLSGRQREVLTMYYYEGRNYNEIAKVINIKYQSVANLMCQSIRKLRKGMLYTKYAN